MKYLKILGLAAIAAAALMAFAGSASATTLTSPLGTTLKTGTTIEATSEQKPKLTALFGHIECHSSIKGKTTNESGTAISGNIESLTWTECEPEGCSATTLNNGTKTPFGTLSIEGSGSSNGTVKGSGTEVTTECLGYHCIWATNNTTLGTLTGTTTTSSTATLDINAKIPRVGGRSGAFCGSEGTWSGSYKVTNPDELFVD